MRGVVQGIGPALEEAAQTLRADRRTTFLTVTLPLLKPGLANAFLVGFIESIADFGNPIVVGGQFSVLSTDIFFAIVGAQYDQGRAASLALVLTRVRARACSRSSAPCSAARATRPSRGKGDARPARCRCPTACAAHPTPSRCRGSRSRRRLPVRLRRRLRADLGPRLHADAAPLHHRLRRCSGAQFGAGLGRHRVELAVHDAQARGASPRRSAPGSAC